MKLTLTTVVHKLAILITTLIPVQLAMAQSCPKSVANGIDEGTGTDYYNAREASCTVKNAILFKQKVLAAATNKPELAWNLVHRVLCGTGKEAQQYIERRILNPVKTLQLDDGLPEDVKGVAKVKAKDVMRRRCAFSPHVELTSNQTLTISNSAYSPGAYVSLSFTIEFKRNDWRIVGVGSYVD